MQSLWLVFMHNCSAILLQPVGDLWAEASRAHQQPAEERGRDETNFCHPCQGKGRRTERSWERGKGPPHLKLLGTPENTSPLLLVARNKALKNMMKVTCFLRFECAQSEHLLFLFTAFFVKTFRQAGLLFWVCINKFSALLVFSCMPDLTSWRNNTQKRKRKLRTAANAWRMKSMCSTSVKRLWKLNTPRWERKRSKPKWTEAALSHLNSQHLSLCSHSCFIWMYVSVFAAIWPIIEWNKMQVYSCISFKFFIQTNLMLPLTFCWCMDHMRGMALSTQHQLHLFIYCCAPNCNTSVWHSF